MQAVREILLVLFAQCTSDYDLPILLLPPSTQAEEPASGEFVSLLLLAAVKSYSQAVLITAPFADSQLEKLLCHVFSEAVCD